MDVCLVMYGVHNNLRAVWCLALGDQMHFQNSKWTDDVDGMAQTYACHGAETWQVINILTSLGANSHDAACGAVILRERG